MFFSAQNYVYSVWKYVYSVRKYVYSVQNNFFFCQKICSFCPKNRWNPLLGRYRFALARATPWSHPLEDLNQRPTENSNNTYSTSKRSVLHQKFTNCSNLAKNTCCSTYSLIAQWQYLIHKYCRRHGSNLLRSLKFLFIFQVWRMLVQFP